MGHLNIRYFLEKVKDLTCPAEAEMYHETDVMCFTETYLTHDHNIQRFLDLYGFVQFRQDVPNEQDHQDQHGILICVSPRLHPNELTLLKVDKLESKVVVIETSKSLISVLFTGSHLWTWTCLLIYLLSYWILPANVPTVILADFNDNLRSDGITRLVTFMCKHGYNRGGSRGGGPGGPGPPLSENLGIDFYSGFRKKIQVYTFIVASEKIQVYTFIVASEKKNTRGGVQFEILRNPGIDFYSGFRKGVQI